MSEPTPAQLLAYVRRVVAECSCSGTGYRASVAFDWERGERRFVGWRVCPRCSDARDLLGLETRIPKGPQP